MPGSAIFRENYQKDAVKTSLTVSSCGDKSGLFNSSETAYSNGNIEIVSDLVTRKVVQTDNVATYSSNNISNTLGNDSVHTSGLNEGAYGSRARIIGNPDIIHKGLHKSAEILKAEIVAARSGFNDNRNNLTLDIFSPLAELPSTVFDAVTSIPEDVADGDDQPLMVPSNNLFAGMMSDVMLEVNRITSRASKVSASTAAAKAKIAGMNQLEKQQKQLEIVSKLPDSATKERILDAVKNGNLSTLLSDPSNEGKNKESTFNKDEYEAKVAEILPELIQIERQC